MDNVNLNALTENAARLGMRIQETFSEHTRDLSITRGGASIFDMPDDKVKNIGKQLDSSSDREKLDAMKRLIAVSAHLRRIPSRPTTHRAIAHIERPQCLKLLPPSRQERCLAEPRNQKACLHLPLALCRA